MVIAEKKKDSKDVTNSILVTPATPTGNRDENESLDMQLTLGASTPSEGAAAAATATSAAANAAGVGGENTTSTTTVVTTVVTTSQHSPGSSSSVSSNGSSHHGGGYTRQSHPRPRSHKSSTTTTVTSRHAPNVNAAPYVPQSHQVHHHQHVEYHGGGQGHASQTYYIPNADETGWTPYAYPYDPASMHPPTAILARGTSGTGRFTPSPHSEVTTPATTTISSSSSSPPTTSSTTASTAQQQQQPQQQQQQHVVNYHINQGEVISLQLGDGQVQVISGPAQIRMVSTNSSPPQPMPMQPPPGHIVQQILDQNGTLQHVILSLDPSVSPQQSTAYVPMHHYGLQGPTNGQPFGPPPPPGAAVPPNYANGVRPTFGTYGPPPPVIPSPSSPTPPQQQQSWQSQNYPSSSRMEERRIRGPTHERLIRKSRSRLQETSSSLQPTSPSKRTSSGAAREETVFRNAKAKDSRHQDDSEESGVGHEEEEETQQLLMELLSNIQAPRVSEIATRSAMLRWGPPVRDSTESKFDALEPIPNSDFSYDVLLSDKGKDGKYRSIFTSHSVECLLTDLRPFTEYHIRIHAILDHLKGGASDTVSFRTQASEPDPPFPPKWIGRTKTSINLRWNAPVDNGVSIQHYILECDEGKSVNGVQHYIMDYEEGKAESSSSSSSSPFVEIYKGRAKTYNVTKLNPSTPYRFRLIAVNELGRSRPSESVMFATQGSAPPKPVAPGLKESTKSSLHLIWSKRLSDEEFVLHMDDRISGHGFLPVYNGSDVHHISTGLRRNTSYKFRLQARNEEGSSHWSDEVSYMTLPDVPGPPLRPASKGRLHPNLFKVRWDPPSDDGGSTVSQYNLEIDDGRGWKTVYQGPELESVCDNLSPGTQYKVRVSCQSAGGVSPYSDVCVIATEPTSPGQCAPPRLHGKPKANNLQLKWGWPETDGGAPVTEFEIDMTCPDNSTRTAYRGRDTECVIASLLPGRPYLFQVRAHNRVSYGPWSESLEVISGAGAPDQPKDPKLVSKSPTVISISWEAPINNGAVITEYRLEMASVIIPRDDDEDEEEDDDDEEGDDDNLSNLSDYEHEDGEEDYSEDDDDDDDVVVDDDDDDDEEEEEDDEEDNDYDDSDSEKSYHETDRTRRKTKKSSRRKSRKPSVPTVTTAPPSSSSSSSSPHLLPPASAAAPEPKEPEFVTVYTGSGTNCESRNLEPATTYLFRLSATNSAGTSPYSGISRITTSAASPAQVSGLRLRDNDSNSMTVCWKPPAAHGENITHYNVDTGSSVVPTRGPDANYTLRDLKPDTAYTIRVQAVNSVGSGPFSQACRFSTRPLPPAPPKIECSNANHNSLKLKWGDSKSAELCHYSLEMENSRHQFQVVYSGSIVSHKINKLAENTKYRFRIYASNEAGQGPYSPVYEFSTVYAHAPPIKTAPRVSGITSDGCLVEWTPVKLIANQGTLHYKVQLTKVRDQESKIIYSGTDIQFRVNGLEPRSEYNIKVFAVRVPTPGASEMIGPSSSPAIFTTLGGQEPSVSLNKSGFSSQVKKYDSKSFTDQQWAILILVGFSVFAVVVAMIMHKLIGWGKSDDVILD